MNEERGGKGRQALTAAVLVALVAACGYGGMLASRHTLHPEATAAPYARPQASAGILPPPGAPRVSAATQPPVTRPTPPERLGPRVAPVPVPEAGATQDSQDEGTESPGEVVENKEVGLALKRWQTALLTNDAAEIAPSYAAHVNRYFLKTQVSREFVQDAMEQEEERGVRLTRYELDHVAIRQVKPEEVEVTFHARFAVSTPANDRAGDTRTTLMMRMEEGDWKIVYERDFRS